MAKYHYGFISDLRSDLMPEANKKLICEFQPTAKFSGLVESCQNSKLLSLQPMTTEKKDPVGINKNDYTVIGQHEQTGLLWSMPFLNVSEAGLK